MSSDSADPPGVHQAVPFFAVAQMEDSLRFYIEGLGFQMTKSWVVDGRVRWCWLEIGKAALMLQEFPAEGRDSPHPHRTVGEGTS